MTGASFPARRAKFAQVDTVDDASRTHHPQGGLDRRAFSGRWPEPDGPRPAHANQTLGSAESSDSDGNTFVDLDAVGGTGLIECRRTTSLILEDGVEVTFTTESGRRRVSFRRLLGFRGANGGCLGRRTGRGSAARSASSLLPARGRHLAGFGDRLPHLLAALIRRRGESCDCTICVTAEQHNQGTLHDSAGGQSIAQDRRHRLSRPRHF